MIIFSTSLIAAHKKSTIEIKKGMTGVIGYGTLMSRQSMEQTLGHKYMGQVYQVHLMDYVRSWAFRRPNNNPQANSPNVAKINAYFLCDGKRYSFNGTVNLNVYPEKNGRMNAILYLLSDEDLLNVDRREGGYRRQDVTDKIEEYDFSGGGVYVYEGLPENPDTAAADPKEYIIIKEYIDQVTGACDEIGESFRAEYEKSTRSIAYRVVSFKSIVWTSLEN